MTTSTKRSTLAIIDTNVLVYAVDSESKHHALSKTLLLQAANPGAGLCVAPQNLAEFYAVVSDRRRVRNPLPPTAAIQAMNDLLTLPGLALLTVPIDVTKRFVELLQRYAVVAQHTFDAYLVATMLGNGVSRIHTFNAADFDPFDELEVLVPLAPTKA
jgi:toxin-antitoxin system PIN domain toxin